MANQIPPPLSPETHIAAALAADTCQLLNDVRCHLNVKAEVGGWSDDARALGERIYELTGKWGNWALAIAAITEEVTLLPYGAHEPPAEADIADLWSRSRSAEAPAEGLSGKELLGQSERAGRRRDAARARRGEPSS